MEKRQLLKGNTETIILGSLQHGPKHGYRISQWVQEESREYFRFTPGMLYPLLHKMEKEKLIAAEWQEGEGTVKKKIYRITEKGQKALVQNRAILLEFSSRIQKLIS